MPGRARRTFAALFAALALAAAAPAAAGAVPSVLVVGDSLEDLTSPYLSRYLPGVKITVNAVGGSNSYQIFELFQQSYEPSQSVIVFDAGTNDNPAYPQILAENLAKVAAIVGPNRCMVVPTIHGYTVGGYDNTGKNRVVREFAASRPGTQVPEWAGWVRTHQSLMADELHPGTEGAEARAELIAQGVLGCLNGVSSVAAGPSPQQRRNRSLEPRLAPVDAMQKREHGIAAAIEREIGLRLAAAVVPAPIAGIVAAALSTS